jgi:hypothetical protein
MQQIRPLFDRLAYAHEQRQRHFDTERLCGLEIDDELDLDCLLHRQISGIVAFEKTAANSRPQTPPVWPAGYRV